MQTAFAAVAIGIAVMFGAGTAKANPGEAADALGGLVASQRPDTGPAPIATDPAPPPSPTLIGRVRHRAADLVMQAMGHMGLGYRRGGSSAETGFDCSGFVRYVYGASLGLVLPRRADEQARDTQFTKVDRADLQPGDLVFFNTMRRTFSHVGIYIGANRFIHSPRSGEEVRTDDMNVSYWARRFTGARRAIGANPPTAAASAASPSS